MLPFKPGFVRRTTSNVYRGGRRHVTKYVARAIYAGRQYSQYKRHDGHGPKLRQKVADAWRNTPTKWYPLPVLVGAILLVALNFRKRQRREGDEQPMIVDRDGEEVVRLRGPLQVHVIGALPLRNLSRLWGYLNSFELPIWFRPTGFRLYAYIFGANVDEAEHELTHYKSLGDFFYRRLKKGARPIDDAILVSPADGKVLHFGTVEGSKVEQVKGLTYSLDALLGKSGPASPTSKTVHFTSKDEEIVMDQEFADINGIEYTLEQLIGSSDAPKISEADARKEADADTDSDTDSIDGDRNVLRKVGESADVSFPPADTESTLAHDASVAATLNRGSTTRPPLTRSYSDHQRNPSNKLHFAVIYLAPGDYHRFHSPAAWVVERRRHFVGELFSVSPFVAKRLANLFVLNERVALLGRWTHGFFSMTPVGATNVGSILLDFDRELRTNVRGKKPPPGTFMEAVYSNASKILRGKPLRAGEEMGGFCLGSTIVLVFEAPKDFRFDLRVGQKVRVGQRMGDVRPADEEGKKRD